MIRQHLSRSLTIVVLVALAVGGALFALNEAHRALVLTTDSIMYADTARHIAAGEGVTTSILELDSAVAPRPQTQWPPFYAMLMAPLIKAGIAPVDAGRYVSAGAFGVLILLTGLWLMRVHPLVGLAASATLLAVPGITKVSAAVWADSTYAVIVLVLCWLGSAAIGRPTRLNAFVLGFLVGIGILTKYLGIILIGAVIAILLFSWLRHRRFKMLLHHLGFVLFGIALVVTPLLSYNLAAGRPIGGAVRTLSSQPLTGILGDTWSTLSHDLTATWLLWLLLVLAVTAIMFMTSSASRRQALARTWSSRLIIPVIVTGVYVFGLIATRTLIHTDQIHTRFVAPVYPLIVYALVVLIDAGARQISVRARAVVLTLITVASITWTAKAYDFSIGPYAMPDSPGARWAREVTTARDLVIGDRAAEFAFRYGYTVIRLGKEPHDPKLTPDALAAVIARWGGAFDRIFIAVTPGLDAGRYGSFTAAISSKVLQNGLTLTDERQGQIVYLVSTPEKQHRAPLP